MVFHHSVFSFWNSFVLTDTAISHINREFNKRKHSFLLQHFKHYIRQKHFDIKWYNKVSLDVCLMPLQCHHLQKFWPAMIAACDDIFSGKQSQVHNTKLQLLPFTKLQHYKTAVSRCICCTTGPECHRFRISQYLQHRDCCIPTVASDKTLNITKTSHRDALLLATAQLSPR